ncbi:DddA-like double-stranded DNA deaminase toxin [Actinokineospora sp. G85]|uniref:DddA-like double-stranded DNA deaminase toxin n=1 Tax=Actinokineospora sp. G85 TaxID=3406626 RepID=UPI003C714E4C
MSEQDYADRAQAARSVLAEAVPRGRTMGVWVDKQGHAHARGWVGGRAVLALTRHVEVQFAMRMRAQYRPGTPAPRETIVIDRPPCGEDLDRPFSCKTHLGEFLPPGAELTVIDRDGRTYTHKGNQDL